MATWKKVIVSGSTANLSAIQVDNLTLGEVVIGGGSSNLSTTAINGTGSIVATTGASGVEMSGSFSGSFTGTFVGTTDLPDLTQGAGIETFTYDGSATATVAVSGASALNANTITKWTGDAFANTNITDDGTVVDVNSNTIVSGSLTVTGNVISTGSLKLQPDVTDARYIEIYNTSAQDTHITASGGWLFLGDDTTYVKVDNYSTNNLIELKADNGFIVSGSTTINGNVIITGSLSYGNNAQAIGAYSLAGGDSTASGPLSHAEGKSTQAIGNYSHAEGNSTQAIGNYSHAEGDSTQAIGPLSHAEGVSTQAVGEGSHAEGNTTKTGGTNGYLATSIVAGLVTLSGSYGDVSADYPAGNYLYINDLDYDDSYSVVALKIDSATFNSTETEILLVDISISTTTAVVGNLNQGITNWAGDQTYRGDYSHAEGYQTFAIGVSAHAEGSLSVAVGASAHAEGLETRTIGDFSHAEGYNTQTVGQYSHAEGSSTQAVGESSHAEGSSTQAIGDYSHAEGSSTQAIGDYSHAEGDGTQAIGFYSHAEGSSTLTGGTNGYLAISIVAGLVTLSSSYGDVSANYPAGNYLYLNDNSYDNSYITSVFVIDTVTFNSTETEILLVDTSVSTTTAVVGNVNLGLQNWSGDQTYGAPSSHAEGTIAQAIGVYSHAEGSSTQAVGEGSHAEGAGTQAIGFYSHAEGNGAQAIGDSSHAEGNNALAIGFASHAEGNLTQASASYSHAEGIGTIASGSGQLAAGTYNTHNNTTSLVVIGNGVDDNNRSDLALFNPTSITFNAPVTGSTFSGSFVGDGSGLTGLATTLSGSTDSGNFEVNLLNQYLTVQGTANEIEVSGSGQTITIGLPSDVTISNNLTVTGDLIVNGTTTVINTTNTAVADQFILLASGSTSTIDAGIIVQNAANAGEAFYWENNTAGTSRWAIASNISPTATTVTAAEYMVTANTAAGAPSTAPTYGGSSVGYGNMYVDSANGDIYIYS